MPECELLRSDTEDAMGDQPAELFLLRLAPGRLSDLAPDTRWIDDFGGGLGEASGRSA